MKEQLRVRVINCLQVSHTDIHKSLECLKKGEDTQAKIKALSALKKIGEALMNM